MKNHSKTRIELQKAPMGQFHCRFHTQSMVTVPHPVFQTFKKHQKTHKQSSAWFFHGFYPGFSPEEASLTMAGIWWLLWSLQSSTRPKKAQLVYSNAESRDKKIIRNDPKRCCSIFIYIYIYQWHINDLWWFMMIYDDLWWFMMIYDDLWWFMMIYDDLWWFMMIYYDLWAIFCVPPTQKYTANVWCRLFTVCLKKKIPENTGTRKHTPCKHLLQEHSPSKFPRSFEHLQTCCSMVIQHSYGSHGP